MLKNIKLSIDSFILNIKTKNMCTLSSLPPKRQSMIFENISLLNTQFKIATQLIIYCFKSLITKCNSLI